MDEEQTDQSSSPVALNSQMYVQMSSLSPQLRPALQVLGGRLEKPGKERLTLNGMLLIAGESQSRPVQIISEFPAHLRLNDQGGSLARAIIFNEHGAGVVNGTLDKVDEAAIEALVYDSAEHFFLEQINGMGTRSLGLRFRLDDGEAPDYTGPFYDIYQITEQIRIRQEEREQTKLYYFNSDTHLLEKVQYSLMRDGSETAVEVQLSDWRELEGQKAPGRIDRLENNALVLTLTLTPISVGPRVNDSSFNDPQ
ncbi:MAG TPA: hypothetical protein VGX92_08125 [Pyrinomonadaceae bacterium]|jgi:hypothetical protein|nr:hypothetical protein [Pyrinomonadaceae bacterium]